MAESLARPGGNVPGTQIVQQDLIGKRLQLLKEALPQVTRMAALGLMSYGIDLGDLFVRAGVFVAKILRGAKPGLLPIEQPRKFEFTVNLRAAKALGLTIPQSVLQRADEVIE